jgi:hypothetical protein
MTTMTQEQEKGPESTPADLTDSDMDKESNETPKVEPHTSSEAEETQDRSVAFSVPEQPLESSLEEPAQRRRGQIEPFQVTGGESQSRRTSYKTKSGQTQGDSKRMSSLELRRLPVNVLQC